MRIETDGGDTWQYGDQETYEDVLRYFNQEDTNKQCAGHLRIKADDILEKVEENYLDEEVPTGDMSLYPKSRQFDDDSSKNSKSMGKALGVLADMENTDFGYWTNAGFEGSSTFDMSDVDYEHLCGVLEAVTRIEDEDLDWKTL
jgi:hypothetical protein